MFFISRKSSIYTPELISIGNNVRIDDFCLLSGTINLGSFIHISAYTGLYGKFGIEMDDFSGLSPRCLLFSASDDFSGEYLVNSMISEEFRNVISGRIIIGKYVQVGAGSILMPGVILRTGSAIASMSFVNTSIDEWMIAGGIPVRAIKTRSKEIINKVDLFKKSLSNI